MLFALLAGGALADGVLVLDEAMLLSMARTREPDVRIVYAMDKLEFRTRRSALVGWIDVALTARFARVGRNIQLAAGSLHTGPFAQKGKRLEQARAGLVKLVNVETAATRVEIVRNGQTVYTQHLD